MLTVLPAVRLARAFGVEPMGGMRETSLVALRHLHTAAECHIGRALALSAKTASLCWPQSAMFTPDLPS
ncbi:hypothetical protein K9U40_06525 [Xanthobacter autotrophicus]|uniref:hypothetical protein n=1 Tax=Xanthobacter TaxID=279 RepID=UPI0024AAC899|nr:hypothetical protein [Xanthobacter autotrophicus]MDI4663983.1 hypothetical protein [Xanthobacter autotrophicus]